MSPPPLIKLALLLVPALVLLNLNVSTTLTASTAGGLRRRRPADGRAHAGRHAAASDVDDEYSASFSRDADAPGDDDGEALSVVRAEMEAGGSGDGAPSDEDDEARPPRRPPVQQKGGKGGRIAWLMSFPNSGTSFTSLLVRRASNTTTATNYGMEANPGRDGMSAPVHGRSEAGPYWLHPPHWDGDGGGSGGDDYYEYDDGEDEERPRSGTELGRSGSYPIPPGSAWVLTKTHCGGRCVHCPPRRYVETPASFLRECLSGSRGVPGPDGGRAKVRGSYAPDLVGRAVHVVRDPFDNAVSRFHHEQKEHRKRGEKGRAWLDRYPNDPSGFRLWCADEDRAADGPGGFAYDGLAGRMAGIPCRSEMYRYARWHDLASGAAGTLGLPVLRVHYEDYGTDLSGTADALLDFLGLDRVGTLPSFRTGTDYSDYFTGEERAAASDFMGRVAGTEGRGIIGRYFVELDFERLERQTGSITD